MPTTNDANVSIAVTALSVSPPAGSMLRAGATLSFVLTPATAVQVTGGVPTLTLSNGGIATYTGQDSSGNLLFSYTVAAGQDTADLKVTGLVLNGASIGSSGGISFAPSVLYGLGTIPWSVAVVDV